jgi:hypothetical protein
VKYSLFTISFFVSMVCNAQATYKIEVTDIRHGHDTINKIFTLPESRKLTVKYICRMFDFCGTLYEKALLADSTRKGKQERRFRNDKLQEIKIRDSLQRLKFDIWLSCITCKEETRGYYIEYSDQPDLVYVYTLTDEELTNYRNNNMSVFDNTKDRSKTTIMYDKDNTIRSVRYQEKGQILFSVNRVE